jgi:hypothetical protein
MFDELEVVDLPPAELLQWIAEDAILSPRASGGHAAGAAAVGAGHASGDRARIVADHVDRQFVAELRALVTDTPCRIWRSCGASERDRVPVVPVQKTTVCSCSSV